MRTIFVIKVLRLLLFLWSGHPNQFIELIKNERQSNEDGFVQRLTVVMPQPIFYDAEEIMKANNNLFSMTVLLYTVNVMFRNSEFVLSEDSNKFFTSVYSKCKQFMRFVYKHDSFLRL